MNTFTTITITKELNDIKSVELLSWGRSRKDVFVNNKKVSNGNRKDALIALQGDVKTTTVTKVYANNAEATLLSEDIKVENDSYMNLVKEAIAGYRKRNYKY